MMCPATFATRMALRHEPPPKVKRRPWLGGASNFDPASLEMVSMNGRIIRLRKAPYKVAQAGGMAHGVRSAANISGLVHDLAEAKHTHAANCPMVSAHGFDPEESGHDHD
jgi:hypothetical protein